MTKACIDGAAEIDIASLLDGLPDPAVVISKDYRILAANEHYRRRFNGGAPVCGRHCYEMSHGYSLPCEQLGKECPMATCRTRGEPTRSIHVHHTHRGRSLEQVSTYLLDEGASYLEVIRRLDFASSEPASRRLVGSSEPFRKMVELISLVARHETSVLLLGESGTGKDLVAQALHTSSARAQGRFVPVDCSGLSETLFESELFGHEKGAFTGAESQKTGLVEAAQGGTLFLDELGDIPLAMQVKLLRLVETRLFRRVGSAQLRNADFRLVCATHRDIRKMVDEGSFRRDLYYRISTFPIHLPPLRSRLGDLPALISSLGRRLCLKSLEELPEETLACLTSYRYPGNIRELRNILERASLLSHGGAIRPEHLPREVLEETANASPPEGASREADPAAIVTLEEAEARYLRRVAAAFDGSKRDLARRLAISERTLYRKLSACDAG